MATEFLVISKSTLTSSLIVRISISQVDGWFKSYAVITFHFSGDGLPSGRAVAPLRRGAIKRFTRAELTNATQLLHRKGAKTMVTILIVLLVLALVGALPSWPYSRGWGYYPSGGLGLVVLILVVLSLMGRV